MAEKVNYNIQIDFKKIMKSLHEVAMSNAKKIRGDFLLDNSIIDDKTGEVLNAGEYKIAVGYKDRHPLDSDEKKDCLKIIQEYVKYFVGEDEAKLIKEKDLLPIVELINQEDSQDEDADFSDEETSKDINQPEVTNEQPKQPTNETIYISRIYKLVDESLDLLFEEDSEPDKKPEETNIVGFSIDYAMDVVNQHREKFGWSKKSKGLFGGVWSDIKNMRLKTLGGGSIPIGKLFDKNVYKNLAGIPDINGKTVDNNIKNIINDDYPQNDVRIRVYDQQSLLNHLNSQGKLSKDIINKIKAAKYSIVISTHRNDPAFKQYNKAYIADVCTKAFGSSMKMYNGNKVTEDDVIQIDNIKDVYKFKSRYEKPSSKDYNSDNPDKKEKIRESFEYYSIYDSVVNQVIQILFENEILDEDGGNNYHNKIIKCVSDPQKFSIILNKRKAIEWQIEHQSNNYDQDGSKGLKKLLTDAFKIFFEKATSQKNLIEYVSKELGIKDGKIQKTKKGADNTYFMRAFWECLDKGLFGKDNDQFKDPNPPDNPQPSGDISTDPSADTSADISSNISSDISSDISSNISSDISSDISSNISSDISSNISSDISTITISFVAGNPEFPKEKPQVIKTISAQIGKFKDIKDQWPTPENTKRLGGYEKYVFGGWQPDPDTLSADGQVIAVFKDINDEKTSGDTTWYIIPHKRIVFTNRNNQEEVHSDGTVNVKTSDAPYKPTD